MNTGQGVLYQNPLSILSEICKMLSTITSPRLEELQIEIDGLFREHPLPIEFTESEQDLWANLSALLAEPRFSQLRQVRLKLLDKVLPLPSDIKAKFPKIHSRGILHVWHM